MPAALAGAALFFAACSLPNVGLFDGSAIGDVALYRTYGEAVAHGGVPYRDFFFEYPPGALALIVPPAAAGGAYVLAFKLAAAGLGALAVACVALTLTWLERPALQVSAATAFAALTPAALGQITVTRYDLLPAVLTGLAVAGLVSGRSRLGFAALGFAAAAKLYPLVLIPLAFVHVGRRLGWREAAASLGTAVAVFSAIVLPFVALGPGGVRFSLSFQTSRPLHVESIGGALVLAAHHLGAYSATVVSSFNSQNLTGSFPDAVGLALVVAQALAVLGVWLLFARSSGGSEELVVASAAGVAAVLAFSKLFSPQFVLWLLPLVPLVGGGTGVAAVGLLVCALALTQSLRAWDGVGLSPAGWVVLARDVAVVGLFALLARRLAVGAREPVSRRRPRP